MFLFASSIMLIALYFLSRYLYYIVLSVFCLVSAIGVHRVFDVLIALLPFSLPVLSLRLPLFGQVTIYSFISALSAIIFSATWAAYRQAPRAWVAQDILGVCFILSALQSLRLPSLKVPT